LQEEVLIIKVLVVLSSPAPVSIPVAFQDALTIRFDSFSITSVSAFVEFFDAV